MDEADEDRLKRLRMRSWRRGMREMDLIFGPFADAKLAGLDRPRLAAYERLLAENDPDLYLWVTGAVQLPAEHAPIVAEIRAFHRIG